MEQTNFVVTPDGKTWDEVTRDTSYIGNHCVATLASTNTDWSTYVIPTQWRGNYVATDRGRNFMNKNFAIAYDRVICLVDGEYEAYMKSGGGTSLAVYIFQDGMNFPFAPAGVNSTKGIIAMRRGDYVRFRGDQETSLNWNTMQITRIK
jgi:hypothetical protein